MEYLYHTKIWISLKKKIAKKYSLKDTDFEELKHLIMSIYGDPRLQVQMNLLLADTIYYSLSDLMVYSQREGVFRNEYILKFPAAAPGPMKLPVILGVGTLVAFYPRTYCYLAFCGRYSFLHTTKAKSALKKATQGVKAIDLDKMGTAIARHDQQSAFNIAVINSKLGRVPEAASLDRFETLLNYDEEFFNALHDLDLWGVAQNDRFTQPATWKTFSEQLLSSDRVFAAGQLKNVRLHLAAYRDTVTEQQNSLTQAQETLQAMDLQVMAKLEREIPAIPALIQKELQNIQTRILKKTHEMSIELESLEEWRKRCSDGIVTIDEFERNIESGAQANSELLPYLRTLKTELTIPEFLKGLQ